jgi:hypothetical protein
MMRQVRAPKAGWDGSMSIPANRTWPGRSLTGQPRVRSGERGAGCVGLTHSREGTAVDGWRRRQAGGRAEQSSAAQRSAGHWGWRGARE